MADTIYRSDSEQRPEPPLPEPVEPKLRTPQGYIPGPALQAAVDVAMLLGQPLLLTGDPGTGKTTLARSIARQLFQDRYLELQVKSTTGRHDLLYRLDELARFRDAQPSGQQKPLLSYFKLQPLGEAIIRACGPNIDLRDQAGRKLVGNEEFLIEALGWLPEMGPPSTRALLPEAIGWKGPERWVVLIDEIDKAPRDTPNDLLEEFERLSFAIPELNLKIIPPPSAPRPVVVVTSNSERSLPEAFMRRCSYHHIRFPDRDRLRRIVEERLARVVVREKPVTVWLEGHLDDLLELFDDLRAALRRPPATAELLAWLRLLTENKRVDNVGRAALVPVLTDLVAVLAKLPEDQDRVPEVIAGWAKRK